VSAHLFSFGTCAAYRFGSPALPLHFASCSRLLSLSSSSPATGGDPRHLAAIPQNAPCRWVTYPWIYYAPSFSPRAPSSDLFCSLVFLFHCSHVLAADEVILGFRSYRRWVRFCWSSVSDSICSTRKHWFVLCFCANLPHVRCRGLFPPSLPTVVGESHFHDSFLPLPSMSIISLIRLPFLFLPLACWIWCGAPWRFFRSCCYRCWCDDWVGCWVKEHHLFSSPLLSPDDDWFIQVSTSTRWVVCPLMFYPFFQFYVDFCIF
jgi:hypothetical protein